MQLKLLWELQEVDLAIKNLEKRIEEAPAESGVNEATELVKQIRDDYEVKESQNKDDRKKLKNLEMKTQKLVDDRKELNENMYNGTVTNVKELEQMHRRLDQLLLEKEKTEDEILVIMESLEEQDDQLSRLKDDLTKAEKELTENEKRLKVDLAEMNKELERLKEDRVGRADRVEKKYMDKYLMLAEKNHGQAVARVNEDLCGGCRVFISSGMRGHLYNPDAMVYCENCGRLLVKLDD